MAEKLDLARDVLDKLLVDKHGREFGRVDGVLIHLRQGRPPRVGEIEVGLYTALRRWNRRIGDWVSRAVEHLSPVSLESVRLPFEPLKHKPDRIEIPVDAEQDERLMRGEKWLRQHVIKKLPGGKR